MDEILRILPSHIQEGIERTGIKFQTLEEIRLRVGRPTEIIYGDHSILLPCVLTSADATQILANMSQHSIYMLEEELKRGFITLRGGHRVGIAGKVITESGVVKRIRDVSSFNIRIAKEKIGCANKVIPTIFQTRWLSTVFIGPPQSGKTTLLRDITRVISYGSEPLKIQPKKVGVVDERSEIAGCLNGVPQYNLGPRVDILDGCPKAEGMMMLVRSMSPNVIVVDEIGGEVDALAILEVAHAGVQVLLSAHGFTYEDFIRRPYFSTLLEEGVFERFVIMSGRKGPGTIESILDGQGHKVRTGLGVMA